MIAGKFCQEENLPISPPVVYGENISGENFHRENLPHDLGLHV